MRIEFFWRAFVKTTMNLMFPQISLAVERMLASREGLSCKALVGLINTEFRFVFFGQFGETAPVEARLSSVRLPDLFP